MGATEFKGRQEVILLADDDENDVRLFQMAYERVGIRHPLHVVRNGEECLSYLEGIGVYADREQYPLPSLLILDLKMPGRDGFEVLSVIRRHPTFSRLRVVVLTVSHNIDDVNRAYDLGANSFLTKTLDLRDFCEQLEGVRAHWLSMSRSPQTHRPMDPS